MAFRDEWRAILRVAGLNVINAVGFYMAFVYVVTYEKAVVHLPEAEALDINTISMGSLLLIVPAAGMLSDRFGPKPLLLTATLGLFLFAYPLFQLLHHPRPGFVLAAQLCFACFIGTLEGALPVTLVDAFPVFLRCSGLSIGFNLSMGLIGGTTPMAATYLITRTHNDFSPAYYLMAAAAVTLPVVLWLPRPTAMGEAVR
jgi:MHS family proline/betaine transporter-like MFS transporter